MFHPTAWLLWWLAALLAALLTQNPLYLTVVLLAAIWVGVSLRGAKPGGPSRPGLGLVLRLGPLLTLFTALFNALTIHVGATILARVPDHVPLLGGPITLEALIFGLMTGLNLVTLLAIFGTFNLAADYHAMLRMVPGFVFQAGLVTSIALAFVPQTLAALEEIREAQMIRGHRFRGWRDLPPLFLPLLTSGLERSIQLAEAMESRGFGGPRLQPMQPSVWPPFAILCGLFAALAGLGLVTLTAHAGAGLVLLAGGGLLALWGLRRGSISRLTRRSRYRPPSWQRRDLVLAGASVTMAGTILIINGLKPAALRFYPYPRLSWPPFEPLIGMLLLLLVLPVLMMPPPHRADDEIGHDAQNWVE
ncbi:MAG: energy-coupling factor transporter transmembrane protein EcfT [Ardenticatenaceae bacterium]|nr:energy-coupling factor transporter transmembrane protein EcfT [Ardenticatenaceae bacterium]